MRPATLSACAVCLLTLSSWTLAVEQPDVSVERVTLSGIPALLRIPKTLSKPPIILWHGFGPPDSEQALMDAMPLDDVPAIKVYAGLPLFGARSLPGGMKELGERQIRDLAALVFEPAVAGAADELGSVVAALRAKHYLNAGDAIGLFGFSAGGAAVLLALADRKVPISTAVVLNASTGLSASVRAYERATKSAYAWTPHARELAKRSDAVGRAADIASGNPLPALLILHGDKDAMVRSDEARALQNALVSFYLGTPERLRLRIDPELAHAWTGNDSVSGLRQHVADWFNRFQ